jgi:hypothetical protein
VEKLYYAQKELRGGEWKAIQTTKEGECMKCEASQDEFDPSLHIVPLDKQGHIPLMWLGEDKDDENIGTFVAITNDGRISFFPAKWNIVLVGGEHKGYISYTEQAIKNLMKEQFPKGKDFAGRKVKQYLLACVMYGDETREAFVFKIVGFQDHSDELESLYETLHSLFGTRVGDEDWKIAENYFSGKPIKDWVNRLIDSLKEQGWADYVRERLDAALFE